MSERHPFLTSSQVFPAKLALSFPLTYHYLGGVRHIVRPAKRAPAAPCALRQTHPHSPADDFSPVNSQVWDMTTMGIDNESADTSSKALFAASAVAAAAVAAM